MRIVIDLDGTLCSLRKEGQDYFDVTPNYKAIEKVQKLKKQWHYIIIQTARHMKSTNGNVWLINKKIWQKTMNWLDHYNIPYDELFFWKPHGDIYIDDNAQRFFWRDILKWIEDFNSKKLQIVIPAAWAWSRFNAAWFSLPKPLIKIWDRTMIEWAVSGLQESFSNLFELDFLFIVLASHVEEFHIDSFLREKYPWSKIITIENITRGQAETVIKAKEHINNLNKLIIYNADTYSLYDDNLISLINNEAIDGIIPCFEHSDSRYSYVSLDKYGYVNKVVEKLAISNHATNGFYYFREWSRFVTFCEAMINDQKTEHGEFYVWPIYNYLIQNGQRIKISSIKENWVLWTPEEMQHFIHNFIWNDKGK